MMNKFDSLDERLNKKYPMLQYFTDRPFGVEIEFFGLNYVIAPIDDNIIKPYCISSRARDGRHILDLCQDYRLSLGSDLSSWCFQADSSVRGKCHTRCGAELTSPILSGLEGLVQAHSAFQLLCDIEGADIDQTCGFHVHHGVDPKVYHCKELQQIVRIVHQYEDTFYLLIPGDRQNAETCRPMEIDVEAFLDICECEIETANCKIKQLWYSPENRYDIEAARNPRYDKTRYHGLNLHSYWYRATIEFRYHSAVLHKIDEAMQWIIFSQFLVEMSQGHVPEIHFHSEANKWLQMIYKIYEGLGYQDRIKQVSN
uniref:Amidoligase family protein n=1 Tax=Candidatus Desulfatibia profunda TaxID=2841695 RepID=A0A8J6THX2_9BACT|nr:amidoligase family protein [Candidatus Desulfatibia profunda]